MIYSTTSRASVFIVLLIGLLAWAVPNQACHTTSLPDTDELTEGPYWIDPMLNRSNTTEGYPGTPYTLTLRVWNKTIIAAACAATAQGDDTDEPITDGVGVMQGVQVDIWHASAAGHYSGYTVEGTLGLTFFRGYQLTNSSGYVTFQTIFPGWYTSRTTHIHIRIRVFNNGTQIYDDTTQLFFDDTVSDSVYAANSVYNHGTRDTYDTNDNLYQAVMKVPLSGNVATGVTSTFDLYYPFATTTGSNAGGGGAGTGGNGPSGAGGPPSGGMPSGAGAPSGPGGPAANQTTPTSQTTATPTTAAPTVSTPTTATATATATVTVTPTTSTPTVTSTTDAPSTGSSSDSSSVSSSTAGRVNSNSASSAVMSMASVIVSAFMLLHVMM